MSGWRKVHLSKVAEIERNSIDPSAISDGTTYIGLENIETGGKFANVRSVSTGELASNKFVFTDKHVLYGKLRPYLAKVARPSFEGICSTDILPILPGEELDRDYLTHFLLQPSMIEMATSRSIGANLPRLSPKALAEFLIPLPPIAEQRRIAAILDKAEELRELRRQALMELDAIVQSIFIEIFDSSSVPERKIGELLDSGALLLHKDGNHGSLYPRSDEFGDEGVPFLSAKSLANDGCIDSTLIEYLREEKARKLKIGHILKGDVLLSHNASVGKVALYDGRFKEALIGTSLTAFRPNPKNLDSYYLAAALRSQRFQKQLMKNMGQTTRNQVPITAQRELYISEPPLPLQKEFARRIEAIEQLKTTHRESLAQLDALFTSLQNRAFRGEL